MFIPNKQTTKMLVSSLIVVVLGITFLWYRISYIKNTSLPHQQQTKNNGSSPSERKNVVYDKEIDGYDFKCRISDLTTRSFKLMNGVYADLSAKCIYDTDYRSQINFFIPLRIRVNKLGQGIDASDYYFIGADFKVANKEAVLDFAKNDLQLIGSEIRVFIAADPTEFNSSSHISPHPLDDIVREYYRTHPEVIKNLKDEKSSKYPLLSKVIIYEKL